ncbi:MAG TPA: carboxypeptidase regulatory-like domain-containing protein [Aquabacterium sp.]|nr:carboxypeptidase regulatory-like domain-containing protein [Aquabacterium sp.]
MKRHALTYLAPALAVSIQCVNATSLSGMVTSNGSPVAGAMVTAFDAHQKRRDTVYTDASGQYTLNIDFDGKLQIRARAPYFQDNAETINVSVNERRGIDFVLRRQSVAEELSASLPASAHLATVPWASDNTRQAFISQCNYCHQVGNALTRIPKDENTWRSTIARMEGYFAILTDSEAQDIAKTLSKAFNGKPIQAKESQPYSPELGRAKIKEWVVGDALSFIHDTDVGFDDDLYGSDEGHDIIWHLNRKTGHVDQFKLPDIDLPEGGVFSGVQLPIGVFTGKHGPHSMAQGKDGRFWITNALSSTLASFDPQTHQFKLYNIGRTHLYPHTVRIDKDGIVWFTITASNEVGRFDPKTEQFKILSLPHGGFWRAVTDYAFPYVLKAASFFPKQNLQLKVSHHKWANVGREAFNFPYGIDVSPLDGSIWYAKLYANKVGRIDSKTLEITEYDTPLRGPRRLRFDPQGNLWIPAFDDSGLMKMDTRTKRFETFKLPLLAHNEYEVPYALNVHPVTGDVWITSNMSDRMFRFNPKSKTFITYPMPTRVTWLRDLVFAKDGGICSSSSNLPAYGIEGGLASFICLYPEGESASGTATQ